MAFGYAFVNLDEQHKHARRILLDYYPVVAQLSVLVILGLFQLSIILGWLLRRFQVSERSRSPSLSKRFSRNTLWVRRFQHALETLRWWMRKPVMTECGTRGEWILGGLWTVWLLYLCVAQTGNDYLHLTKRFGIIGVSQLPLLYLLAMRSPYSPLQILTRRSHEELKASHQVLGRIIFFLLALHTVFYLNFFVVSGFLSKRIKDRDVIFGVVSILLFSVITTTALGFLRRWNYRVFYTTHVVLSNLLIVPLFVHVSHIRPYVYEILVFNGLHFLLRIRSTKVYRGTISRIADTNLVQIRIPLRAGDAALKWKPGQHVYLTRPASRLDSTSRFRQLARKWQMNPFTVASVPAKDKELMLVARALKGNTAGLASLEQSFSTKKSEDASRIDLALEGPYGSSIRFPTFKEFDKILFVAGGVGATFVLPLYRSVVESDEFIGSGRPQVRFVWAVRKLAESSWAFDASYTGVAAINSSAHNNVLELFVTRASGPELQVGEYTDQIELAENEELFSAEGQMGKPHDGVVVRAGRPGISAIVDEFFRQPGRTAVFTCGPKTMTEELGEAIHQWVRKGEEVYWHEETFGW
ncbi:uncharacterized protein EI97DRAFT_434662 [Westerdykella ornata]|uniref:FAD-binding FR-type domain-containing protein n=1 Tax=Westerdykella ornata TaxID=318751 RepID=A0A6A6JFU9_WESOR|nr:uncharacterized protein EI97DRAFT_434662 [Westerdykella ornata]KAF2275094.1 hypothetical protein EI97DRAFT_434662 [Westerdykella ornata]